MDGQYVSRSGCPSVLCLLALPECIQTSPALSSSVYSGFLLFAALSDTKAGIVNRIAAVPYSLTKRSDIAFSFIYTEYSPYLIQSGCTFEEQSAHTGSTQEKRLKAISVLEGPSKYLKIGNHCHLS